MATTPWGLGQGDASAGGLDLAASAFLRLSSRGEALVAELLRLSEHIPRLFLLQDKPEQKAYGDVLLDFRYLKTPELFEHRIESSAELVARDEDVWENHGDADVDRAVLGH